MENVVVDAIGDIKKVQNLFLPFFVFGTAIAIYCSGYLKSNNMLVHRRNIQTYSSYDANAKWELKYYWDDDATIECRYFASSEDAEEYAENEGYPIGSYTIVPNKR